MEAKSLSATAKGDRIIALFKDAKQLQPILYRNQLLTAEDGTQAHWSTFIKFPQELSMFFPGSYISPMRFLHELGVEGMNNYSSQQRLVSHVLGSLEKPEFAKDDGDFSLIVLNGLANEHALAMSEFASLGFNDSANRAQYQHHMFSSIESFIKDQREPNYGVRIFDDCIASGDSIAGYLYKLIEDKNPLLKQGVEITAVTATAQSILFLKHFAKAHGIHLRIRTGQLAFGLTEGIKKDNGVREHANYITYPEELLPLLSHKAETILKRFEKDGAIAVVGDMGEAEKGVADPDMKRIREEKGEGYCPWNDTREDIHGDHPLREKIVIPAIRGDGRRLSVYLARGGYLPYEWDRQFYPSFKEIDKIIEKASRLWTKELGYGVGINGIQQ